MENSNHCNAKWTAHFPQQHFNQFLNSKDYWRWNFISAKKGAGEEEGSLEDNLSPESGAWKLDLVRWALKLTSHTHSPYRLPEAKKFCKMYSVEMKRKKIKCTNCPISIIQQQNLIKEKNIRFVCQTCQHQQEPHLRWPVRGDDRFPLQLWQSRPQEHHILTYKCFHTLTPHMQWNILSFSIFFLF